MKRPRFCCDAAAARTITQLALPNGFQAGIVNLDGILKEVAALGLDDAEMLKKELLVRVRENNYLAPGAEDGYGTALIEAYRRKYGDIPDRQDKR